jgi:uncharacterized protein (TIGR00255 family)
MKSMTGYGYCNYQDENYLLSVEIKGYNNRFLEINVNQPPFLSPLESWIRESVSLRFSRGKIEINIRFKEYNASVTVNVNRGAVEAYSKAIAALSDEFNLDEKPSLQVLLGLEGVLDIEKTRDDERYCKLIEPALQTALEQFAAERDREGKHTEKNILSNLDRIEILVNKVSVFIPAMEKEFQENLRARFKELLGDAVDENRILTETAVLLVKYTIAEELSRLEAHLAEFRAETERNSSPGKKLDFLCQEINREINTIGSKTPNLEVSRAVVDMKDALENIREQLRNVE